MNLAITVLIAAFATSMAVPSTIEHGGDIGADSTMGMSILSKARRVEQDAEEDFTWIAGYSLKFQGCHHVTQWNEEADGEDDVRLQTKRLVRFRLCPIDDCAAESGGGCNSGYGDYIIDMNTFIEAYMENKNDVEEYTCEYTKDNVCDCEDSDDKGDDFDRDQCEYNCYADNGLDYCIEEEDDDAVDELDVEEYMECANFDVPEDENGRRLEEDNQEDEYYLGPYCAEQGGKIYLGMFTDDTCTTFADEYGGKELYSTLVGQTLPYSSSSLIGTDCFTCLEPKEADEQNDADVEDEDEVKEFCVELYETSGKCEYKLGSGSPNNNACTYMKGIKITRKNGVIISGVANKNKVASAFIGIFAVSFILLGAYVYYLKTKLDRAKINLSD